jgi:hypothetical protein
MTSSYGFETLKEIPAELFAIFTIFFVLISGNFQLMKFVKEYEDVFQSKSSLNPFGRQSESGLVLKEQAVQLCGRVSMMEHLTSSPPAI